MKIFLYISGTLSSLLLFMGGWEMASIKTESSSEIFGRQTIHEVFYNRIGSSAIGLSLFTGPALFGLASLIGEKNNEKS
jgi:hypothetical protein